MKILFSVGNFEKELGASNKLAIELAKQFSQAGIECIVAGSTEKMDSIQRVDKNLCCIRKSYGLRRRLFTYYRWVMGAIHYRQKLAIIQISSYLEENGNNSKAKIMYLIKHPFACLLSRCTITVPDTAREPKHKIFYRKFIRSLVMKHQITDVICLQEPSWSTNEVFAANLNCRVHIYQVDPYGMQTISLPTPKEVRIENELQNFEKAACIFTTPALLDEYVQEAQYAAFVDKYTAVEFPNLFEKKNCGESVIPFDPEYINVLYCGMINYQYRDPSSFIKMILSLADRGVKVRCYFLGEEPCGAVREYGNQYPNNIFVCSPVPAEKAYATMQKADILLNIGNSIHNMVPSKIFDYFSLGKPIINIQKIENCPARGYFDRHPACLTIEEFRQEACEQRLVDFLYTFRDYRMPYEQVRELYIESTPEYVAELMLKKIAECG